MEKLKTISSIGIGLIIMITLITSIFGKINSGIKIWIFAAIILIILYLIITIKTKIKNNWIKSSHISNIVSTIIFILTIIYTIIMFSRCNNKSFCDGFLLAPTYLGTFITGIIIVIGFILWLIGTIKENK